MSGEFDVTIGLIVRAADKTNAHRIVREWLDELEAHEDDYVGMTSVEITPEHYRALPQKPAGRG